MNKRILKMKGKKPRIRLRVTQKEEKTTDDNYGEKTWEERDEWW